jgi:hypothetical protein
VTLSAVNASQWRHQNTSAAEWQSEQLLALIQWIDGIESRK